MAVGPSKKSDSSDLSVPSRANFVNLFLVTFILQPELKDWTLKSVISVMDIPL